MADKILGFKEKDAIPFVIIDKTVIEYLIKKNNLVPVVGLAELKEIGEGEIERERSSMGGKQEDLDYSMAYIDGIKFVLSWAECRSKGETRE